MKTIYFNGYVIYQRTGNLFEVDIDGRMFASSTLQGAKTKVLMNQRTYKYTR